MTKTELLSHTSQAIRGISVGHGLDPEDGPITKPYIQHYMEAQWQGKEAVEARE